MQEAKLRSHLWQVFEMQNALCNESFPKHISSLKFTKWLTDVLLFPIVNPSMPCRVTKMARLVSQVTHCC